MHVGPSERVEPQTDDSAAKAEALSQVDGASEQAASRSAALHTLL